MNDYLLLCRNPLARLIFRGVEKFLENRGSRRFASELAQNKSFRIRRGNYVPARPFLVGTVCVNDIPQGHL